MTPAVAQVLACISIPLGIFVLAWLVSFALRMLLHIPNARKNADTMHGQMGGWWWKHYVDEWIEKVLE